MSAVQRADCLSSFPSPKLLFRHWMVDVLQAARLGTNMPDISAVSGPCTSSFCQSFLLTAPFRFVVLCSAARLACRFRFFFVFAARTILTPHSAFSLWPFPFVSAPSAFSWLDPTWFGSFCLVSNFPDRYCVACSPFRSLSVILKAC